MTDEHVFAVSYPDPHEAMLALDRARFEFECLLDYVAQNHPRALVDAFGSDLSELAEGIHDEVSHVAIKYL